MNKLNYCKQMYDYNNINEYIQYHGNIVYISNNYIDNKVKNKQDPYFVIITKDNKYAVLIIDSPSIEYTYGLKNRDNSLDILNTIESSINWIPAVAFKEYIIKMANSSNKEFAEELIFIKNSDVGKWVLHMVEYALGVYKPSYEPLAKSADYQSYVTHGVLTCYYNISRLYDKHLDILVKWTHGSPFADFQCKSFVPKGTRKLYFYDLYELCNLFEDVAKNNIENGLNNFII